MLAAKYLRRFATVATFTCALTLAGCKKDDPAKAQADPESKEKKRDGGITTDDLRRAAKAAGGDFDKPMPPPEPPKPPDSLARVKPDVVYTVKEYMDASKSNSEFFLTKHPDKVLEVTGVVEDFIQLGSRDAPRSVLWLWGGEGVITRMNYPIPEAEPWKKVVTGQTVTLRWRTPKTAKVAYVFSWEIVEVKGPAALEYSAEQLSNEWASGKKELDEKLKGRWVLLTGEFREAKDAGPKMIISFTAGGKPLSVVCEFYPATMVSGLDKVKAMKPGQKVQFFGKFRDGVLADSKLLEPAR